MCNKYFSSTGVLAANHACTRHMASHPHCWLLSTTRCTPSSLSWPTCLPSSWFLTLLDVSNVNNIRCAYVNWKGLFKRSWLFCRGIGQGTYSGCHGTDQASGCARPEPPSGRGCPRHRPERQQRLEEAKTRRYFLQEAAGQP